MKKVSNNKIVLLIFCFVLIQRAAPAEVGDPLNVLSQAYGFFSGEYHTWGTCRGVGENIEVFVENAMWDSSITDVSYALPSNNIFSLEPDGNLGGLFLGTEKGLAYFDGTTFTDHSALLDVKIIDISSNSSTAWIATNEGLYKFVNGAVNRYYNGEITAVKAMESSVWIGTLLGLVEINNADSTWTDHPSSDTTNSPVSNVINSIEVDANGIVWLATDKGVNYRGTDGQWVVISSLNNLISDNIVSITLDGTGFWASTDKGLTHYIDDTTYYSYERKNSGLTVDPVNKVLINNGVRWVSTNDGFFSFEGSFSWYHYGADYRNYLEAYTTDTLNSLVINEMQFLGNDLYLATDWGLTKFSGNSFETWRGPFADESFSVDSAMIQAVIEAWDSKTPSLDTSHYFYNGVADILGVNPGGDTLGIYDEISTFYGNISDVDQNGKVSVMLMDIQDYWDDVESELDGLGDLTYDGFFLERNLVSVEPTMRMDLLYIDVRRQSQVEINMALANTLAQHIIYNNDVNEERWLSVGFGMLAEILAGYPDQSIGFRGFSSFNFPCQNSILNWQNASPYADMQLSELTLLYTAEKFPNGNDGGLGILHEIITNSSQQGMGSFNSALQNHGSDKTFADLFFELGITAVIEQQKLATTPDHPLYNFSYMDISSMTEYNTIYWGKNNQDSPPYLGVLSEWSTRVFNGRTSWDNALREFRLLNVNGDDGNSFRIVLIKNPGSKPTENTIVTELSLDENNEVVYPISDSLVAGGFSTYSILYTSLAGTGAGVTQMVISQDVVSPDLFGGISIGVIQNPLEGKMLDIYVSSFEPLYQDVGDGAFTDDGGSLLVFGNQDTVTVGLEKVLTDESLYSFSYEYTYPPQLIPDSVSTHYAEATGFHLYHAEFNLPEAGEYELLASGQDVSGNDVAPDTVIVAITTVTGSGKTLMSRHSDFIATIDPGTVTGSQEISLISIPASLIRRDRTTQFGMISNNEDIQSYSDVFQLNSSGTVLKEPMNIKMSCDLKDILPEDMQYVGIYKIIDGQWTNIPSRIDATGEFVEAEVTDFGTFQVLKGTYVIEPLEAPISFSLSQNFPNPFNPSTIIQFSLPDPSNVTLSIYNVLGQEVAVLINNINYKSGSYTIEWNGKGPNGNLVASGSYIYRIKAGKYTSTNRMILIR